MGKIQLVSLTEAIKLLNEAHQNDPAVSGRDFISKGTLYNALHKRKLTKHGARHFRQVDVAELLALFGPKKSA